MDNKGAFSDFLLQYLTEAGEDEDGNMLHICIVCARAKLQVNLQNTKFLSTMWQPGIFAR